MWIPIFGVIATIPFALLLLIVGYEIHVAVFNDGLLFTNLALLSVDGMLLFCLVMAGCHIWGNGRD